MTPLEQMKAILLDEVSSPAFIVANKKLLQAHVDGALLGQSATQLYTYFVFLWRIPIILTTNNFDYSAYSKADQNWLNTNCVAEYIGERVWVSGSRSGVRTPPASEGGGTKRVWRSPQRAGPCPMALDDPLDMYGT